jgi:hypothetical protein
MRPAKYFYHLAVNSGIKTCRPGFCAVSRWELATATAHIFLVDDATLSAPGAAETSEEQRAFGAIGLASPPSARRTSDAAFCRFKKIVTTAAS